MSYEVATPVYQGPFDLLLHLILKEEVDLWELSLVSVVDAFLAEVDRLGRIDLEVTTEFLLIAATLVDLKARRLLPGAEPAELDEELLRFEERDLLLGRLLECKTFKDVAATLDTMLRAGAHRVARTVGPEERYRSLAPDPLGRVTPDELRAAAERALAPRAEPVVSTDHIAPVRANVRDAIDAVLLALPVGQEVSFRRLVAGIEERLEVIVRFLAVLELCKQGVVDLTQFETFGELTVRRVDDDAALDAASIADWGDEGTTPAPEPVGSRA